MNFRSCCFELRIIRRSPLLLPPPVVASEVDPEVDPEVAFVVASRVAPELGGTPVAVPPLAPVAATKAVTSPDIVDLHPLILVGNFLLSSRRAYNNLFRSGVRDVLTKKTGF